LAYGAERDSILRAGLANVEQAVSRSPHDPQALEIRGTLLWRMATALGSFADRSALVTRAGADLHAAVTEDPSRASAWATLSQFLIYQGSAAEADVAAKRALAEDAYLANAADIHDQLYRSALLVGNLRSAREWCSKGRILFPADWRFVECQLSIMLVDTGAAPNPAGAWALVAELGRIDPADQARAAGHPFSPIYRQMAAAAISARSGRRDSAQSVIDRARRLVQHDSVMNIDLDYDEAYVRLALGEEDKAVQLLDHYLTERPSLSAYVIDRDPLFARIRGRLRQRSRRE
jgi:predicted Zn-dependent protease